ncbi:MAG: hypothetical protein Q9165_002053 [Trypethelium subeluteriae]
MTEQNSSSRIVELAELIAEKTRAVNTYLVSGGLPQPSFEIDGPSDLGIKSDEVEKARMAVIGASMELQDLLQGPVACLRPATCDALEKFNGQELNETAYSLAHCPGESVWSYYDSHPDTARRFASSMDSFTSSPGHSVEYLATGYSWSELPKGSKVIDIGGSKGHVSIAIAKIHKQLLFVVQDLPAVINDVELNDDMEAEVQHRIEFEAHDFLIEQKREGDVYLLRWILHDWPDKYVVKILRNLIPVLKQGNKILINDFIIPGPGKMDSALERNVSSALITLAHAPSMASEMSFGGADDENAELRKLNAEVLENPDEFETWEKLVRAAETQEGGLNRNSSPQAISSTRSVYDRFLAKFPLFFGYWKKYADLEFSIAGTEAAEMVYERGVASISNSADLWTNFCAFKVETSHDPDVIRELFERGANCVGPDFLAHPFWDKYLEFEERLEAYDRIFAILGRVILIPMHQYARYFERYRQLAQSRPVQELAPSDRLAQFRAEIDMEGMQKPRTELEIDRELRARIDQYHLEIFHHTQTETTKRWTYEQEIKRPYFHVTELDEAQLVNWRKYLDFEEAEGSYQRTAFLYERCLVAAAYYEEFWLRFARWMFAQDNKQEEVRNIYQRASCLYLPISKPAIRIQYALFEEMSGRPDVAEAIHEAILMNIPGHVETIISWANLQRRQGGLEAAIEVLKTQIDAEACDIFTKAAAVAHWAKLLWKIKGSADEARQVFQENQQWYLDSKHFWSEWLFFELQQPTSAATESTQQTRIKQVHNDIRRKSRLTPEVRKELAHYYQVYLLERGGKDTAKEYMDLDREDNGSIFPNGFFDLACNTENSTEGHIFSKRE